MTVPALQTVLTLYQGDVCVGRNVFVWGTARRPLSVGAQGEWVVRAPGVADIHLFLAFDGRQIHAAGGPPGTLTLLDGNPLDQQWHPIAVSSALSLGEARMLASCEPIPAETRPSGPPDAAEQGGLRAKVRLATLPLGDQGSATGEPEQARPIEPSPNRQFEKQTALLEAEDNPFAIRGFCIIDPTQRRPSEPPPAPAGRTPSASPGAPIIGVGPSRAAPLAALQPNSPLPVAVAPVAGTAAPRPAAPPPNLGMHGTFAVSPPGPVALNPNLGLPGAAAAAAEEGPMSGVPETVSDPREQSPSSPKPLGTYKQRDHSTLSEAAALRAQAERSFPDNAGGDPGPTELYVGPLYPGAAGPGMGQPPAGVGQPPMAQPGWSPGGLPPVPGQHWSDPPGPEGASNLARTRVSSGGTARANPQLSSTTAPPPDSTSGLRAARPDTSLTKKAILLLLLVAALAACFGVFCARYLALHSGRARQRGEAAASASALGTPASSGRVAAGGAGSVTGLAPGAPLGVPAASAASAAAPPSLSSPPSENAAPATRSTSLRRRAVGHAGGNPSLMGSR